MKTARTLWTTVVTLCASTGLARGGDPHLVYHTLDTPHFEVTYYDPEGPIAQETARAAELAHDVLVPVLHWEPRERTQLVLVDWTDDANGSATVVPYNEIRLYATAPDDLSQLNDYDQWVFDLVAHEYTHILHLDNITGLPRLINYLIGKTYAPNGVEPRWFVEGFAVLEESARTSAGRERNSIFDMYLRMAVLSGENLHGLDQTSNDPLTFPQATTAYLYGSHFLEYIADTYGADKIARYGGVFGGKVLPFSLNTTAKQVFGKTYPELWDEWMRSLRSKYAAQKAAVDARGETPFHVLTHGGQFAGTPRYTHDGRSILFSQSDGHHRDGYYVMNAPETGDAATPRLVLPIVGEASGSFTPDDRMFVFQRIDVWNTNYFYNDLWVWDRMTGAVRQLTHGLRAAEPDVSPDGRMLVFTTERLSDRSLVIMPLAGGLPRALLAPADHTQFYTPVWSHDGTRIAYSAWTPGGFRDVYVLTLATGAVTRVTADRALDVDPRFSPDDHYLYFSSDRTGIYNLYAYDLVSPDHPLLQVTNVLDGVFQPDISPDGKHVVYSGFSAVGYDLHEADIEPTHFFPATPYVETRPPAVEVPAGPTYPIRDYDPFETLWPHSWCVPSAGSAGTFGPFVSGCVLGQDAVGYHAWDVAFTYSPTRNVLTGAVDYAYSRLWPGLSLHLGRDLYPRSGLYVDGRNTEYLEQAVAAQASIGLPLVTKIDRALGLTLGYGVNVTSDHSHPTIPLDPTARIPIYPATGRLAGVGLSLNYSNVYRELYAVGPVAGRAFGLGLQLDHTALGSNWDFVVATYGYSEAHAAPWSTDQTFQLRLGGGIAVGNYPRGGVFGIGGFGPPVTLLAYAPQTLLYDAIQSLTGGEPALRGYPPGIRYGNEFQLATVQYQFPLWLIERGYATLPVYVRRLEGAIYSDAGNAFTGELEPRQILWGVGAELRLDLQFGWYVPGTIEAGYARGITGPGVGQWYIMMGSPL